MGFAEIFQKSLTFYMFVINYINSLSSKFVFFICLFFFFLQSKPHLVEPIDFENFILKNKTLLQNDPQRELLLYPQDDISVSYLVLFIYKLVSAIRFHL